MLWQTSVMFDPHKMANTEIPFTLWLVSVKWLTEKVKKYFTLQPNENVIECPLHVFIFHIRITLTNVISSSLKHYRHSYSENLDLLIAATILTTFILLSYLPRNISFNVKRGSCLSMEAALGAPHLSKVNLTIESYHQASFGI